MLDQERAEGLIARTITATKLWDEGNKLDAAILFFVATAATSRIRYPRLKHDREAFTRFVRDEFTAIIGSYESEPVKMPAWLELPGIKKPENFYSEDIFYHCWRCVVIHEARWSHEVYLTPSASDSDSPHIIDYASSKKIGLPEIWIKNLGKAVQETIEILLPTILSFPIYILYSGPTAPKSGGFQIIPGKTNLMSEMIHNRPTTPLFTLEDTMKNIKENLVGVSVGQLPTLDSLIRYVNLLSDHQRYIFNPSNNRKLPHFPFSKSSLLSQLK